jgi:LysR family glycine cleavage system transcriptional activator
VLVLSTPPGFTAKWLAPRLYRFTAAHPQTDVRVSSSHSLANFTTDGVDAAVRSMAIGAPVDPTLVVERLAEMQLIPVCSPRLIEAHGPLASAADLARVPLIHDDSFVGRPDMPGWGDWFRAAGVAGVDVSRGLRFNSTDHALDAASEAAGVMLAHHLPAYDDVRTGRLVIPVRLGLAAGRAYCFVCPKSHDERPHVRAFRAWLRQEVDALDERHTPAIELLTADRSSPSAANRRPAPRRRGKHTTPRKRNRPARAPADSAN